MNKHNAQTILNVASLIIRMDKFFISNIDVDLDENHGMDSTVGITLDYFIDESTCVRYGVPCYEDKEYTKSALSYYSSMKQLPDIVNSTEVEPKSFNILVSIIGAYYNFLNKTKHTNMKDIIVNRVNEILPGAQENKICNVCYGNGTVITENLKEFTTNNTASCENCNGTGRVKLILAKCEIIVPFDYEHKS